MSLARKSGFGGANMVVRPCRWPAAPSMLIPADSYTSHCELSCHCLKSVIDAWCAMYLPCGELGYLMSMRLMRSVDGTNAGSPRILSTQLGLGHHGNGPNSWHSDGNKQRADDQRGGWGLVVA